MGTTGKRKLTKNEQQAVGRKIQIISKEDPGLTHRQVVGKAVGIVKSRSKKK